MYFLPLGGNAFLQKSEQPDFKNIPDFVFDVFEKRLWNNSIKFSNINYSKKHRD